MRDEFTFLDSRTITYDLADVILGKKIGAGVARDVYECKIDRTLVIKIESAGRSFQNIKEYELWDWLRYDKSLNQWLAPCVSISACGTVLVQKKVVPAYKRDLPVKVPKFFTDLKEDNWGMLDGRVVCFDYGSLLIGSAVGRGLKRADWALS